MQENESQTSSQLPTPKLDGVRYSKGLSPEVSSPSIPEIPAAERKTITSDGIDKQAEENLGPSAFSNTDRPFLARLFELGSQEIMQMGLQHELDTVDSYILEIMEERQWKDNKESYAAILLEIKNNAGINENVQDLIVLKKLSKIVPLLKAQREYKKLINTITQ